MQLIQMIQGISVFPPDKIIPSTIKEVRKMSRSRTPLVPSKREALNRFKLECAREIGYEQFVKENNDHYKGDLPSYINGKQGAPIGGQMEKKMIQMAEEQMQ